MNPNDWDTLQRLFAQASALVPEDVPDFLQRECGDNEQLRSELAALLRHDQDGEMQMQDAIRATALDLALTETNPWQGRVLGAYRIASKIAEGGMGAVFLGERADQQYQQQVAIKILNISGMSPSVHARFRAERQILASLHHPNIASLVDGGATDDGIPYLVMEYIDGEPIDRYCETAGLSLSARLKLFLEVCAAVQYAHQNLVVHRDIKPCNILVDEHGTPKLLDFGIAKPIQEMGQDSLPDDPAQALTRADMRLLTPEYASPEQVRGEKVTTATDVYALGLLLYRLLTGEHPYQFTSLSPIDVEQTVCHTRPDRPSVAVQRAAGTATGARLARQLRGDLDNIILLTLHKEPECRYHTVRQLADDIQCYLDNRPVQAQPPSLVYHMKKFVERNRLAVVTSVASVTLLLAMISYYTLQLAAERDRAQLEARKSVEIAAFLTGLFKLSDPAEMKGVDITARELLDRGARQIERDLAGQPRVQATMMGVMGQNYSNLGIYPHARDLFEGALAIQLRTLGEGHPDVLASRGLLGLSLRELGKFQEARSLLEDTLARRSAAAEGPNSHVAASQHDLASVLKHMGEYETAKGLYLQALETQRQLSPEGSADTATTLAALGVLHRVIGDYPASERYHTEALTMRRRILSDQHLDTGRSLNMLGNLYLWHGEIGRAQEMFTEALSLRRHLFGEEHISVARTRANLANIDYQIGNYSAALPPFLTSLEVFQLRLGEDHPQVAFLKENIANVYLALGQHDKAYQTYVESLLQIESIFGSNHLETAMTTSNVGGALLVMQRYNDALPYLIEAHRIFEATVGPDHQYIANTHLKRGQAEQGLNQYTAAETSYRQGLAIVSKSLTKEHPLALKMQYALADVMSEQGRIDESVPLLEETLALWRTVDSEGSAEMARTAGLLGACLARMNRFEEAEPYLLESHDLLQRIQQADHEHVVEARERLADLYLDWDQPLNAELYQ